MKNSNIIKFIEKLSPETKAKYLNFWGHFDNISRFLIDSYVNAPLIEYVYSRKIDVMNKNILEFGCRDGSSFTSWLYFNAKKIVGMDIDENSIDLSKSIYKELGYTNIEFRTNGVEMPLPAKNDEFDIISCNAIIEHISPSKRSFYIKELQRILKPEGYIIFSDTPNRLWIREGHTTGLFFINYLPFKIKCFLGSKTKRFRNKIAWNNYQTWIDQGIVGVTYKEINDMFSGSNYSNKHDLQFSKEYYKFIPKNHTSFLKNIYHKFLFAFAFTINLFYLIPKGFPSLAVSPTLIFSFKRMK